MGNNYPWLDCEKITDNNYNFKVNDFLLGTVSHDGAEWKVTVSEENEICSCPTLNEAIDALIVHFVMKGFIRLSASESIDIDHNLRTPLNAVIGYAELIEDELANESHVNLESQIKDIKNVGNAGRHALGIINELLAEKKHEQENTIFRSIVFSKEHYLAGLSIITYFAEIVKKRYPDENIEVKIGQTGNEVFLTIHTPDGKKEIIKKDLEDYYDVVTGKLQPDEFLPNQHDILELKQQLRIAQMQLENKKELLEMERTHGKIISDRLTMLERQTNGLTASLSGLIDKRFDIAFEMTGLINELSNNQSKALSDSLTLIKDKVMNNLKESDEGAIKNALTTIADDDSKILKKIKEIATGAVSSASGSLLHAWVLPIFNSLPK